MKCIYGILNKLTGQYYIGSAVNFYKRKGTHLKRLKNKEHHSYLLQKDWNEELFNFIILEKVLNNEDLINREQWWIDNTNSYYNIAKVAGSSLGIKRSDETKEKIRKANLGIKHPEWRNKIKSKAQGGINHWTKNKKFSNNAKKNMSISQKRLYDNGYISPRKGSKDTIEQLQLKRERASKPIVQYDLSGNFIKEWSSAKQASLNGFRACNIGLCCQNKRKTHKNFLWKFKKSI